MFKIAALQFSLKERALEIYISGCEGENKVHCKNCHNPELWDPSNGYDYDQAKLMISKRLEDADELINSIRIYGGEPLEKPILELVEFFSWLKSFNKELWLFTRFEFKDVPTVILELVDYIKCGAYKEELKKETEYYNVVLATSNQRIYKKGIDYNV